MRKLLVLVCFLGFFRSSELFAQNSKLDFGFLGGPSITNMIGNYYTKDVFSAKIGFSAGFQAQWNFNKHISLASGFFYERKGTLGKEFSINAINVVTVDRTYNYTFDYLVVPVLFKGLFGEKLKFYLEGGPYMGLPLRSEYTFTDKVALLDTSLNLKKDYKPFDFGMSLGWGAEFPILSRMSASFTVRNNISLLNIYDPVESINPVRESERVYSTNVLIGIHYKLTNDKEYKVKEKKTKTKKPAKKKSKKKKKKYKKKR